MSSPHSQYDSAYFLQHLRTLALAIRSSVGTTLRESPPDALAAMRGERGGDMIYQLDEHAEEVLLDYCVHWGQEVPFALVAEGIESGAMFSFPPHSDPSRLAFTLIADPIDGTRGLMYGKRSAWTLLGIAPPPAPGGLPTLADIQIALQGELPTPRAALTDMVWAVRGAGVQAETHDLRTGESIRFTPHPSGATTLVGGFAGVVKFFPGTKAGAVQLEEQLFDELLGPPSTNSPQVFDDEYISSGGQLYELMVGHDRFIADLRPLLLDKTGRKTGLCAHPYDLSTALVAQEAGVIVTDGTGNPLSAPLDTTTPVAWIGYANAELRQQIEPVLLRLVDALPRS